MADVITFLLKLRGTREFVGDAHAASDAIKGVGSAAEDSSKKSAAADKRRQKGAAALDKVAGHAKYLAIGIAGLGAVSFKAAADFDQAMNVFGATASATGPQMKEAGKRAVELGNDAKLPGVSARDAADAMNELAKGGFNAAGSMKAARSVLLLGQAANTDYGTSATIVARELKAFGMEAGQSQKVVDTLGAAALKSTVGIQDIADGMAYVSTSAHGLGIDVTDTTTAIALLNDRGIAGAKAGSSLNMMLLKMAKPTKQAKEAMKDLGLMTKEGNSAFFDAQGRYVGMRKQTELLTKAMKGRTDQEKIANLQAMFGVQGGRAAQAMLMGNTKVWDKYRAAVGKAGQTQKLASAQAKGAAGALEQMKNATQTLQITFGQALAPAILAVLRPLTRFMSWLTKYPKQTAIVIGVIGALAGAIWVLNAAMKAMKVITALAEWMRLAAAAAKIWSAMQWLLNASLWGFPVLLIIAAVIAVIAIFVIAYKKIGWFHNAVQAVWQWIKGNWPLIVAFLAGPIGVATLLIVKHFDTVKKGVFAVRDAFVAAFGAIKDAVRGALNFLIRGWNSLQFHIPGFKVAGHKFGGATVGVPKLPELAAGGTVTGAGGVTVGERGPESLWLPRGAVVEPLPAAPIAAHAFGSAEISTYVTLDRKVLAKAVGRYTADQVARR